MENKIKIAFELTDELGNVFSSSSEMEVFSSLGENVLDVIGEQLNVFLRQCGYYRPNSLLYMEDITEEEYDAIANYLATLRMSKEKNVGSEE